MSLYQQSRTENMDFKENADRLSTEISLLKFMYPEQITYITKAQEVSYRSGTASFALRIPDGYPSNALPEVLAAHSGQADLREKLRSHIQGECPVGEECLDAIILAFEVLTSTSHEEHQQARSPISVTKETPSQGKSITILIYLHHLLNTNKRKQCLNPSSPSISGVTKPGYPGVLLYSGPAQAMHEHVDELKALNWQAFQVRMETEEEWGFRHGRGVLEVEGMGNVVREIEEGAGVGGEEAGRRRKGEFLGGMRMI